MFLSPWLCSLRARFQSWKPRPRRSGRLLRKPARFAATAVEALESRTLLTQLISILPNSGIPLQEGDTLHEAPTELTFRFTLNQNIDPATLDGIQIVRAGFDGAFGDASDVPIAPGFVGLGERPNEVVFRFAQTLPDDLYQITIVGDDSTGATPLATTGGLPFNSGVDLVRTFTLDLGAQVMAVVPQPVVRDSSLVLEQLTEQVVVYFNHDELDFGSATNPAFYQLVNMADQSIWLPHTVDYALVQTGGVTAGQATLHFDSGLLDVAGTWKLQIGESDEFNNTLDTATGAGTLFNQTGFSTTAFLGDDVPGILNPDDVDIYRFQVATLTNVEINVSAIPGLAASVRLFDAVGVAIGPAAPSLSLALGAGVYYVGVSSGANVSYDPTDGSGAAGGSGVGSYTLSINVLNSALPTGGNNTSFTGANNLGVLGVAGQTFGATIATLPGIAHPAFPGGLDEPGHRFLPPFSVGGESHIDGSIGTTSSSTITTFSYNFRDNYGFDPQGNPVFNAITENQKQRSREVFELVSYYTGLQFVETPAAGLTIVTGDPRVLDPTAVGVGGIAGGGLAIMNANINWGQSEYGGGWFRVAFHEIGHLLGLGHSYDLSSIMGGGLGGEPVFPGDHDLVHLQRLHRPISTDIDLYRFDVEEAGWFTAETVAQRLGGTNQLDTVLTLYHESEDGRRELIARNDDYYSQDSFLGLRLEPGTYYVGVSSTGNTNFDPTTPDSGFGGTTAGLYELKLDFAPDVRSSLVDLDGTPLDGSLDGRPGGAFEFWFQTGPTIFVDASFIGAGDGSLASPHRLIPQALASAQPGEIVRIVGNDAGAAYEIGLHPQTGVPLRDGATFEVPQGVTVMIDAGAVLKFRSAMIDVGTSAVSINRGQGALQVLGTPFDSVTLTSWHDRDGVPATGPSLLNADRGDWGGLVFRRDSDREDEGIFLNYVSHADLRYGGGSVFVDSVEQVFTPIHLVDARPTAIFNTITRSADAAISADLRSFYDEDGRIGPHIRGNTLVENTVNGLFVRILTSFGTPIEQLRVPARWDDTDIVHVVAENLHIFGGAGGPRVTAGGAVDPRLAGRLAIDPGVIVKVLGSRFEAEIGSSNLIAEGTPEHPVVFTSVFDDRYGRGGTSDTNDDGTFWRLGNPDDARAPGPGDWGGLMFLAASRGSFDHAVLTWGGGIVPIEGTFAGFNVLEIHQADVRIANSIVENNAGGVAGSNRSGRGNNTAAAIFVRGAQPIIVDNLLRDNQGNAISINANALQASFLTDWGRSTGLIDRYAGFDDNRGPLVALNLLGNNSTNGMEVRPGLLTSETVWDDTDIVHVLRGEIIVLNHHTFSGLRLESNHRGSLVVKLSGANAGFTANGVPLEITDRIGGTIQVVGRPEFPVVLTSLSDDTIGAGFRPDGMPQFNTNNSASETQGQPGQWRSILFDRYSNDRNVAILLEQERTFTTGVPDEQRNERPATAQFLGELARNEKSGDDNLRLGFEVHGFISLDDPGDVDVYSFRGVAGTEVWFDVDRTDSSLDVIVELINAAGAVVARAINNTLVTGSAGAPALPMLKDQFERKLPDAPGDGDFFTLNPRDAGMRVVLPGTPGVVGTYFVRVRSNPIEDLAAVPPAVLTSLTNPANPLNNLADNSGLTSGGYQLQVRLRQLDEFPGSTVRYADIRYATNGIEIAGLPAHSPLLGETAEAEADNNVFANAQHIGNLLTSDRATISVAGSMSGTADIDWYSFDLNYDLIQPSGTGIRTFATIFDIDYADGIARPDLVLSVFNAQGQLIMVARASDISDDQPGFGQGTDFDDLSRGSAGKLDPYIGTAQMPAGSLPHGTTQRYFVAVSSSAQLPAVLNATFASAATAPLTRLEPINSITRIAEDHIGFQGYNSHGITRTPEFTLFSITSATALSTHVVPFTLADVVLFVSTANRLFTINPFTGQTVTDVGALTGTGTGYGDIAMRPDGTLYGQTRGANNANAGNLRLIDTGTAAQTNIGDDGIATNPNAGQAFEALAFRRVTTAGSYELFAANNRLADDNDNAADGQFFLPALWRINPATGAAIDENANVAGLQPVGLLPPGRVGDITGLAFSNPGGSQLFAVDQGGNLWQTTVGGTAASRTIGAWTLVANLGVNFTGLTLGPQNLEGGAFSSMFFGTTTGGQLLAFNTAGVPQPVFAGGASAISMGVTATGLAFSPLDFNLWHPTMQRAGDAGHGINPAFDNSRTPGSVTVGLPDGRTQTQAQGGASFYFGLEQWQTNPVNNYFRYGPNAQLGVLTQIFHEDLTTNPQIGGNYNLPGGALGSLQTNPFSLVEVNRTDKPTLYFNYFLETQNANSNTNTMRDSARVLISADGGDTWHLLATNNSVLSAPGTTNAELPAFNSVSRDEDPRFANQRVEELFDNTGGWRQARVDLADFAGQTDLILRFDFSTAGSMGQGIPGDQFGNFNHPERGQQNAFEGFYVDDILVGFAERGEMVTGAPADQTGFFAVPANPNPNAPARFPTGPYQLEIRRGSEYAIQALAGPPPTPDIAVAQTFNTNDRFVSGITLRAPDFTPALIGQTFTISDAVPVFSSGTSVPRSLTFEFTTSLASGTTIPGSGNIAVNVAGLPNTTGAQVAVRIAQAINSLSNFNVQADARPAPGSAGLAGLQTPVHDNRVGLTGATQVTNFPGGVERHATNLPFGFRMGDRNTHRDQGHVEILANTISFVSQAGIFVRAGQRDAEGNLPHPGAPINGPVLNNERLSLGVSIVNNVIHNFAAGAGILFGGDPDTGGAFPAAAVPFGRIINNTLYGGDAGTAPVSPITRIGALRPGFEMIDLPANDDGSSGLEPIGFDVNFFGQVFTDLFVNNNGNVTFNSPLGTFTPFDLLSTATPIIAPFFADVDTRAGNIVRYGQGTVDGRPAFGVTWRDVTFFSASAGRATNSFQLVLIDRSMDFGPGDFDIEFNYERIVWETGEASGGTNGLGGNSARVGFSNGVNAAFELPGSAVNGAFLDNGPFSLVNNNLNSGGVDGTYVFEARDGDVGGGGPAGGEGIVIRDNAGPTLLNNIIANTNTAISIDASSASRTVVGTTLFQNNGDDGTRPANALGTNPIELLPSDPLFVDPAAHNFYLAEGSRAIDSSLNSLQDRTAFTAVRSPLGLPPMPILSPDRDLRGLLRLDDPNQPPPPGLGTNIFKDRGAIERADFVAPSVRLFSPEDNDPAGLDQNPEATEVFLIAPVQMPEFVLQFLDQPRGLIGLDHARITSSQFELRRGGVLLTEGPGNDYIFEYNQLTGLVRFIAPDGNFTPDTYTIDINRSVASGVRDLAGNRLQANQPDGSTRFTITMGPLISIEPGIVVAEGDSGTTAAVLTLTLSAPASATVTVDVFTADGTATAADNDYIPHVGTTVTFAPGQTTQTVTVLIVGDDKVELDEFFFVNLSNAQGGLIDAGQAVVTILNDDQAQVAVSDAADDEGNPAGVLTFTVTLSNPVDAPVTVDVHTADGIGPRAATVADNDYVPILPGTLTLTFNPGEQTQTFTVTIIDDAVIEPDEHFFVNLTNLTDSGRDVIIGRPQGVGTIINDDFPDAFIDNVTLLEGDSGQTAFVFTVTLSGQSFETVTIDFTTADGTALASDLDYLPTSGTLTFAPTDPADPVGSPGETQQTITVFVLGDVKVEPDETFFVNLTGASGANIVDSQGLGTILNDDTATVSISDASVVEGDSGTRSIVFTVSSDRPASQDITVVANTAGLTATPGVDFVPVVDQLVTIPAGATSATLAVQVIGDLLVELDETFAVNLSNPRFNGVTDPSRVVIGDLQGIGTILNDDTATITINDVALLEGDSGTTPFQFTVSMDRVASHDITVLANTQGLTATGGGVDFLDLVDHVVTIPAGATSATVTVQVIGENLVELNETFAVNLSQARFNGVLDPSRVVIGDPQGLGTILNDDTATISINDVALAEGDGGTTAFQFTVSIDNAASRDITVVANTQGLTATGGGVDFVNVVNQTVTIPAGATSALLTVPVVGDLLVEPDETFAVNLSNPRFNGVSDPSRVVIGDAQGLGTILNDDVATITINDVALEEGDSGTTAFVFTVSIDRVATRAITVVADTQGLTATGGGVDFIDLVDHLVTIPAGAASATLTVQVIGDDLVELDETFAVNLSNARFDGVLDPSRVVIGRPQGIGTIVNDDQPSFSINDVQVVEGNSGTTLAVFTVTLLRGPDNLETFSVDVFTSDGTATASSDYAPLSTTLVFPPGSPDTQTVAVTVFGDTQQEDDETFFVNLANPVHAIIARAQGVGTIIDDDSPLISINDVTVIEPPLGSTTAAVFTVSLSHPGTREIRVDFSTVVGTASDTGLPDMQSPSDFQRTFGTLVFPVGTVTRQVHVTVNGDDEVEDDETFFVALTNPVHAKIARDTGTGTIIDTTGNTLTSAAGPGPGGAAALTDAALTAVYGQAIVRWAATGLSQAELEALSQVTFQVLDLGEDLLAQTTGNVVRLDLDAAGWGWFVDPTPGNDDEFTIHVGGVEFAAPAGSPAAGRMDLLTAVMHELGHVLGLSHADAPHDLMSGSLPPGSRRLPAASASLPIADQQLRPGGVLALSLPAQNTSGTPLSYTAELATGDPLAALAWQLDQTHRLTFTGSYSTNWGGAGEKWMRGDGGANWYFITPNGTLYRWTGAAAGANFLPGSTRIAQLDATYHANPARLHDAQPPQGLANTGGSTVTVSGNQLILRAGGGFEGEFDVRVTASDGGQPVSMTFRVSVVNRAPELDLPNVTVSHRAGPVVVDLPAVDADGEAISYTVQLQAGDPLAALAYQLDQTHRLTFTGNYTTNWGGAGEKWMRGDGGANWYFITPNGTLYRWTGAAAGANFLPGSTQITKLDATYHANPARLHDAQPVAGGDVGGSTAVLINGQIVVTPGEGFTGNLNVRVTANDGLHEVSRTFTVTVVNEAPELDLPNVTVSHTAGPVTVDLSPVDADGDAVTYSVELQAGDPLAALAYQLDQTHRLTFTGNYTTNWGGAGEKWMRGDGGTRWYFITPNGTLYRWTGAAAGANFLSGSTQIAKLDATYHANPARLHDAQPVAGGDVGGSTAVLINGQIVVTPGEGFMGDLKVRVTASDGVHEVTRTFTVAVTNLPPELNLPDRTIPHTLDVVTIDLPAMDGDGEAVTYSVALEAVDPLAALAYQLDQTHRLTFTGNYSTNWGGAGEKWMRGDGGTRWYFITPDGTLYRWNGSPAGATFLSGSTRIATLDAGYHANPARLHDAQPPAGGDLLGSTATIQNGHQLVIDPGAAFRGELRVRVTASDGVHVVTRTFTLSIVESEEDPATAQAFAGQQLFEALDGV